MDRLRARIEYNLKEIRQKGLACVFLKALKLSARVGTVILDVPVVVIVFLLKPFVRVRFGRLRSDRIGHYAYEPERYLCQRDAGLHNWPNFDIFYNEGEICNSQLKKMWGSQLRVLNFPGAGWFMKYVCLLLKWMPKGKEHVLVIAGYGEFSARWALSRTSAHLSFSPEEEKKGKEALAKMGVPADREYVCIYARDSAHMEQQFPGRDWNYHNYRDDSIQDYLLAAEMLTQRGYFVIRMGHIVKEALKASNPMIIDYATNGFRSDFLDIYLPARCRFFLGNPSGLIAIPAIFRRPIAYVNFSQPGAFYNWDLNGIFIWKRVWLRKQERFLTFPEMLQLNLPIDFDRKDLKHIAALGEIDIVDNSPEDIRDLAVEMEEKILGIWRMPQEAQAFQEKIKVLYPHIPDEVKISTVGAKFICQNAELLNDRVLNTRAFREIDL